MIQPPEAPIAFKADDVFGSCDDVTKKRFLFVNGMETSRDDARKHAKGLADGMNACVQLLHNPATLSTGIQVVQEHPELPALSSIGFNLARFFASAIGILPGVKLQSRSFEAPLVGGIRDYVYQEVGRGRRANIISFSLGNVYTYRALLATHPSYRKYAAWHSVGSPIQAAGFKDELQVHDVSTDNLFLDPICTLTGTNPSIPDFQAAPPVNEFEEALVKVLKVGVDVGVTYTRLMLGVIADVHNFENIYTPRIIEHVKKSQIYNPAPGHVKMCSGFVSILPWIQPGQIVLDTEREAYMPCEEATLQRRFIDPPDPKKKPVTLYVRNDGIDIVPGQLQIDPRTEFVPCPQPPLR